MDKDKFDRIVAEIHENDQAVTITPRNLLRAFNFHKRTKGNVVRIDEFLERQRLETEPNYTDAWVDAEIELRPKQKARSKKENDPVQRIMILAAANKPPVSVSKESNLKEAITLMMMHNFSQLPVIGGTRNVYGVVTWESIGYGIANGMEPNRVIDFARKEVSIISYDTPLLDAVPLIIQKDFVLVKKTDSTISGIVTLADISEQFISFTEPFLLLEQIENHIRQLLNGKFLLEDLQSICDGTDRERKIEYIDDLSFGEYVRLIEKPENWDRLQLSIERSHFIKFLDRIRKIRNDVMHFDPEGISSTQKEDLIKMSNFLMELKKIN